MLVLSALIFVLGMTIFITVLSATKGTVPSVLGYSVLQVRTGSMEPKLPVGSIIIVKETDTETLNVGDIISYYVVSTDQIDGQVNTHRIIDIQKEEGKNLFFKTKGDANNLPDDYIVHHTKIIGKMVYNIGNVGSTAIGVLLNPKIIMIFIIIPLILIVFSEAFNLVQMIVANKQAKLSEKENGEEDSKDEES